MAPNYLTEEYNATAANPDENNRQRCHVLLQITPFHLEEPGLRIHYPYSVSFINNLYKIQNFAACCTIHKTIRIYRLSII